MALIPVSAKLTTEDLVAALELLEPSDAEAVSRRLLHMQASRKAPHIAQREAELLKAIQRPKRLGFRERYDELTAKHRSFTLTVQEHEELQDLTDETERFDAERLEALSELAGLRQIALADLMKQLGLRAPSVV